MSPRPQVEPGPDRARTRPRLALAAVLLLAPLLGASGLAAQEGRTPVLPQIALPHSYYYRELYLPQLTSGPSSAAWTPDGRALVYSMAGSLWRQEVGRGLAVELTDGGSEGGYDYQPDVSPDGRRVAFVRYDGRGVELMLLDLASGETRRLTETGAVHLEPRWSPDGSRLAYVSTEGTGHFLVHTARVEGGALAGRRVVTPDRKSAVRRYYYSAWDHAISPVWSRDGRALYAISNREVPHGTGTLVRLDLEAPRGAEEGAPIPLLHEETSWKTRPDLSPDGTRFVYASYLGAAWHHLWLLPAAGGSPFPLTYGDFDDTSPRWSPDGKRIAFVSNREGNPSLWIVEAFGGGQAKVEVRERRYLEREGKRIPLRLRIVDEAGKTVPARLGVTDGRGRFHAPAESWIHADDSVQAGERFEAHYVHVQGEVSLDFPPGRLVATASRGPEYEIARLEIDLRAPLARPLVLPLKRLPPAPGLGPWWSGDLHVHMNYGGSYRNTPERLVEQARAENLSLVYDLVVNKEQRIPDQAAFRAGPDPASRPDLLLLHGQEFHTSFWGHLGLLRLGEHLLLPDYAGYPYTAAASLYPHNRAVADAAHAQGGVVGVVHPFETSEVESVEKGEGGPLTNSLPADAALGKVDYYEAAGFADHRASAAVWYRLLSCGLRLPAGAGTDAMANYASLRGPVGLNRVYVPAPAGNAPVDGERFLKELRAGRGVATNGPLLALRLGDAAPGDTVRVPAGKTRRRYEVGLRSNVPVERLELVWNGEVLRRLPLSEDGRRSDAEGELELEGSGWLLLRAGGEKARPEVMDLYPFATTNPIFVEAGGRPYRDPEAGRFFLRWLDRMRPVVAAHPDWRTPEEAAEVLRDLDAARAVYAACAEGRAE